MPRLKKSIGKEIGNGRESEAMALLGADYPHIDLFKGIQASQATRPLTHYGKKLKEELEQAILKAVKFGDTDFFKVLASLLETAKQGPRSPLEFALIRNRPKNLVILTEMRRPSAGETASMLST